MNAQLAFFAEGLPRQRHSETSVAAAESVAAYVPMLEQKVLSYIHRSNGCSDEHGALGTGLRENTYRPRRIWLTDNGYVKDSGRKTKGTSGRLATVWEAT